MKNVFALTIALLTLSVLSPANAHAWKSLSASPSWVNFPDTKVGQYAFEQYVTIRNTGDEDINGVFANSSCFGDIDMGGFCPSNLGKYQSCDLRLSFRPTHVGTTNCTINISGSGAYASVQVTGRGVQPPNPLDDDSQDSPASTDEPAQPEAR